MNEAFIFNTGDHSQRDAVFPNVFCFLRKKSFGDAVNYLVLPVRMEGVPESMCCESFKSDTFDSPACVKCSTRRDCSKFCDNEVGCLNQQITDMFVQVERVGLSCYA